MPSKLPELPGYQIRESIYEGERTLIYRGIRISDSLKVAIKLLRNPYPDFSELVQLRNQYAIAQNLNHPGIVMPLSLEHYGNGYALVMPEEGAISLDKALAQKEPLDLTSCLQIAIQLADILQELDRQRVIHKDIKPANLLIQPETKNIKLIDFSIASLLSREAQEIYNCNILEGTLAYISPEQTGRMNRGIDYRSDFYSLGVTLYQLLTGRLPFTSNDPIELVHCHISQQPIPPASIQPNPSNPAIPLAVSQIVMKLMAKNAEDRYQSALGLKFDLEKSLKQWQETGKIEAFELASRDIADRFLIPEKLYGREVEVETLLAAFERIAEGKTEMMLVAGFSGIGKTAVINEVHKPITRQKGYFIQGKFDQFNRNIPFSAFVIAFRNLIDQLLSQSDAELADWQDKILAAVGNNGQVLIDVIPELESVIGQQSPVPELSGSAAQNRFNLLFQKFIAVFTRQEHPLVIFLDDLQWADSASLNLMKVLMRENNTGYLLLLGAYRDNEVFPAHPLMLTLAELEKQEAAISTIALTPLAQHHINQLVAETLSCKMELAAPLTELIYCKTQGNPFFTTQFLKGLYKDELIVFNRLGYWECDLVKVQDAALTDDVVEFIAGRLQKLPEVTQTALKLAACIGNQFDLETLAIVRESSLEEVAAEIWSALQEGIVLPISEAYKFFQSEIESPQSEMVVVEYRFLHDRVQQAAYTLIAELDKKTTHLKIGQLLLTNTPDSQREEKLFDIVNQLNYGVELICQSRERQELAELNLKAAQKAKASTAYAAAVEYLNAGIDWLSRDGRSNCDCLTLALYELAAEVNYLNGDIEQMEYFASIVMQNAKTLLDRVKVCEIKVQAAISQNQLNDAIQLGLDFLGNLDIHLPQQVTSSQIDEAFAENDVLLEKIVIEEVVHFDRMSDPKKEAAIRMITIVGLAMYIANPELLMLGVARQVNLCLQYGNTSTSADAYATYGLFLCGERGEIEKGYRFGKLAVAVLETLQTLEIKSLVYVLFNGFIKHWHDPCRDTLADLQNAYHWGLEMGDLQNAALSAYCYCSHKFLCGIDLGDIHKEIDSYVRAVKSIQQLGIKGWLDPLAALTGKLVEPSSTSLLLLSSIAAEEQALEAYRQDNDRTGIFIFAFSKMLLAYLWNQIAEAIAYANIAREHLDGITGMALVPCFYFYDTAILLSAEPTALSFKETTKISENKCKLQELSQYGSQNLQHKSQLLEAESCRWSGDRLLAMELYDRAIAGAKENEYIQEEALANELAAKFYLDWGKEKFAALHMQEAYYCYSQWGAKAKVQDLETRYPELLKPILQQDRLLRDRKSLSSGASISKITSNSQTQTATLANLSSLLDFSSLLKASQTLSVEIEIERLLSTLIKIILENAGATKGALLLSNEQGLTVEAIATRTDAENELKLDSLHQSILLENYPDLPAGLINYVRHTTETALLDAKTAQARFAADNYLLCFSPQSLLCLPLLERGNLIGILYLENTLMADAFTRDRVELLDALCAQAAISLTNARLYEQAQQALKDLQQAQLQLVQNEKMATLGTLVAGVAHEINNPVGFIGGNVGVAQEHLRDLLEILSLYQENASLPESIAEDIEDLDPDFIAEDFPKLIASMQTGCDRIRHISRSLRTFSRTDKEHKVSFNLHEGIDSTLLILKYRLKANEERPAIKIVKNYGNIPVLKCYAGQLNQVFMNLIANAIDALDEKNQERSFDEIANQIKITTFATAQEVTICIADNGMGMLEEVKRRIFEQGFTTKAVGKGTGLGMAIARQIVEEKHGGVLSCQSELDKGTEFTISLPVH
ncbi:MAG: AAA family ATPase [Roseofilum sp. SBFL]|uniref:trifunctional serine/threonine-protein kinase/ATP-binding protein/sensor histidine kinase n=1 Tax=unclassified Roseofilum TaxID=2620099 RepID=UPI001B0CD2A8|nr:MULTISPECIES: AAA family ATPase [unclassified Roseofilum]MBP0012965.1 AAA family ATPase [Roseofilum sp. SID3]MBP0023378.1 AAA family ATPase [Roseofilum sp. SID2]MBP0036575.1 AAA family ATPase [Roseofilum sp. SID1]MBP0040553.1 AAA family ATPase [Roseofilum sp. SBFL]